MSNQEKPKVLGQLLSSPFRLANLPFKSYRQYYGKPKKDEKYVGNIIQKQRVKKIIPLILGGLEISSKDKLFMDLFNDFLTSENHEPMDQTGVAMKCDDCLPYFYKGSSVGKGTTKSNSKTDKEEKKTNYKKVYTFNFNQDLKPKNSLHSFKKNSVYDLVFLGKRNVGDKLELMFRNKWFEDDDDYLIFRTKYKNPFGEYISYDVFQNNKKTPLPEPLFLGNISIKIS